ncbi:MAG: glycosyltransferase, partial [Ferruginibacter sp.]
MNKEQLKVDQPLVSIITLNWNNLDLTLQFLESCRKLTYINFELLVCDMNSDIDPTETILAGNYPNTKVLKSPKNLGWGPGNNWGMKQARGEYYFVVNNDTEITSDLLEILLQPLLKDKSIG